MRIDRALVARGLVRSRGQAQELIGAGRVHLNGTAVAKASALVSVDDRLQVEHDHYVSRAAHKLLGALDDLNLSVGGRALDAGASTGGFTQVLLERGCQVVYAVDVGHGQLAAQLRQNPSVVSCERTNLRDLTLRHVDGEPVDLVVADVSFISLTLLVPPLTTVLSRTGDLLLMVKPQFEVGRAILGKNGVVRSTDLHRDAIARVAEAAAVQGWLVWQIAPSRLPGPAGNLEYFVRFRTESPPAALDLDQVRRSGDAVS
ncbi:MAG TPA: TlyA family RNA methyltransferase [Propionibacteriaceae bacterium]|nr:TlyA family RNA methyltransferase [Propionibacteriaceae bacterium]